jgi:hypothetical protein
MPLLGSAAVAMWWDVAPAQRAEFEDWHSHEHFPERLRIPGFLRGSRCASADDNVGFFVLYELESYETLTAPPYRERLDNPTPWSVKMMPHHRNMVRSQCRIVVSCGGGIGGFTLTVRLSPGHGRHDTLRSHLRGMLAKLPNLAGITGAHLLETDTPAAPPSQEQRIRGGDAVADWIVLVSGHDPDCILGSASDGFAEASLAAAGALPEPTLALYRLAHAMTPHDL